MGTLALFASLSLFASTVTIVNFDTAPLGRIPPGWSMAAASGAAPRWEIVRDSSAATQPYVFAYSSDPGRHRPPVAILDSATMRDGDLSVRIKPVSGQEDQGGGLVWRYRDERNYYLAWADALNKSVSAFKVQDGKRTELLAPARREIPSNGWTLLKVYVRANRFQVYVNHRRALDGRDPTFSGPGKVGLWTDAGAVTYFDDFRVNAK